MDANASNPSHYRVCGWCRERKLFTEFGPSKRSKKRLDGVCLKCREIVTKSCLSKDAYQSFQEAASVALRRSTAAGPLRSYKCDYGEHWHLTSRL